MQNKMDQVKILFGLAGVLSVGVLLVTLHLAGGGVEPEPWGNLLVVLVNFGTSAAVVSKVGAKDLTMKSLGIAGIAIIGTPLIFWVFLYSQAYLPVKLEIWPVGVFIWLLVGAAIVLLVTWRLTERKPTA